MRGIKKLRSYRERAKLFWGTFFFLKNWKYVRDMARRARKDISISERPILRFRNGLKITMVPGSYPQWDILFREIFLEKCYRPAPDFIPRQGWTIIDLGANMGFFTCQNGFETRDARVVSVEPLPLYAETLKKNIKDNQLVNVQLIQGAVCGEANSTILIPVWYTSGGELKTGVSPKTIPPAKTEIINVKGFTLPEIFQIGNVQYCDLLKVDIEGAEYELFEKIPDAIWEKISRIVMEVHNSAIHSEKEIVQILERKKFKVNLKSEGADTSLLWAKH